MSPVPERLFVMAGMPRAGTTSVYDALTHHPAVFLPFRKEVGYFSTRHHRGEAWYRAFFAGAAPGRICGDISPDCFLHPDGVKRLQVFQPAPHIILAVREPASWAVSFHRHLATFEWRVPPFAGFLTRHRIPDTGGFGFGHRRAQPEFSIAASLIERTVEQYRAAFGTRLLLYSFAHYARDPVGVLRAIETFLGLPPWFADRAEWHVPINSRRRRHLKLVTFLLSREVVVAAAGSLLPGPLLQRLRLGRDRRAARQASGAVDPAEASDLELARRQLAGDARYVEQLFAAAPIQLGDGTAFPG